MLTGLGDTKLSAVSKLNQLEKTMLPVSRRPVNKRASARRFGRDTRTVAAANVRTNPMRGGIRL